MPLHKLLRTVVEMQLADYCDRRVPVHLRDRVRMTFRIHGNYVTLFEERRLPDSETRWARYRIAQFRYDEDTSMWSVYWENGADRWERYDAPPSRSLKDLLKVVDANPRGCFFG